MRYINSARHLPGDPTPEAESLTEQRENIVQGLQGRSSMLPEGLKRFRIFSVQMQRSMAPGEKLLVRYRINY